MPGERGDRPFWDRKPPRSSSTCTGSASLGRRGGESSRREAMTYRGINFCDHCGRPLEPMQWLCGLCRACEEAAKDAKRLVETVKPTRTVL